MTAAKTAKDRTDEVRSRVDAKRKGWDRSKRRRSLSPVWKAGLSAAPTTPLPRGASQAREMFPSPWRGMRLPPVFEATWTAMAGLAAAPACGRGGEVGARQLPTSHAATRMMLDAAVANHLFTY